MESVTWLIESLVGIVRGALGIASAPRRARTYAPAYAVIPRCARAPARRNR